MKIKISTALDILFFALCAFVIVATIVTLLGNALQAGW